ncbi:MAG: abortive infection protein [Symbiobacteriaceae bacterium]|jgi:membrane protease YdiL (CAAX protease family)|nr:abortive infection protein [Symbiobacteriaceae bacterium]
MKRFVSERPVLFSSLYVAHTIALFPLLTWLLPTVDVMALKLLIMFEMIGTAGALLWLMGWWREAGFNRPSAWREMHLHWIGLVLPACVIAILGIKMTEPGQLLGLIPVVLLIGIQEEMIFRGLAMRALLPGGALRAVLITSVLFGVMHFGNLFGGADLTYTVVQVIASILGAVGLGAIRVRTKTTWGLVVLHAINDYVMFITRDEVNVTQAQSTFLLVGKIVYTVVMLGYGLYLLRDELPFRAKKAVAA